MKYHFKIHKERKGYWAECLELKGCVTQGDSFEELKKNMEEALNLFLDEPSTSKATFPLPLKRVKGRGIIKVPVSPKVALAFLLRNSRLGRKLTQQQTAKLLGMKGLYSYQRLECSKTANPEFETIIKIKKAFPELPLDELLAA
mgnify:CR=1 FL=1